jgi:hypothetical protein
MAPTSYISDGSIPTSAHALQVQKAVKALRKQQKEMQGVLVCIAVAAIGFTGILIGYLLNKTSHPRKRRNRASDWARQKDGISEQAVENDALTVIGFDRRFR